jgi:hypothetical protein
MMESISAGETDDREAGDVPEIRQRLDHRSGLIARLDHIRGKTPPADGTSSANCDLYEPVIERDTELVSWN